MNDRETVLNAIRHGFACLPEIVEFTGLGEKQVSSAINNLRYEKKIEAAQHQSLGRGKGRMPSIYREKQATSPMVRVNSVFALSTHLEQA